MNHGCPDQAAPLDEEIDLHSQARIFELLALCMMLSRIFSVVQNLNAFLAMSYRACRAHFPEWTWTCTIAWAKKADRFQSRDVLLFGSPSLWQQLNLKHFSEVHMDKKSGNAPSLATKYRAQQDVCSESDNIRVDLVHRNEIMHRCRPDTFNLKLEYRYGQAPESNLSRRSSIQQPE